MQKGFSEAYPDIAVKHKQVYIHDAAALFSEQITLQSDEIDIFEIPVGSIAQRAIEKGYYVPLNQSKLIREKAAAYRPFFQQSVIHGSDIAQQAEITPFNIANDQLKAELFVVLIDQYYLLMVENASAVPLYEAELTDLLDKLSSVCSTIPNGIEKKRTTSPFERFASIQVNDQPSYLFNRYCSFLPGRRNYSNGRFVSDFVPIALTLPSQDSPLLLFEGTLFFVNPYSSQKERAIQWIEFYMNHLPAKDAATFDRDASPLEFETYRTMKEYYTEEIAKMESRIKAAEGAAKGDLESQLQVMQETLEGLEQIKWDVSTQALEDYERMFAQYTVLWDDRVSASSFSKTYVSYLNEGLPGETVAHEFFAAYEMILKEAR